jgi:hypothetical protein
MLFHAYASLASFANTLASYRIGSDPVGLENTLNLDEANFPLPLDQGKHRAYSLFRFLLCNTYIMPMIVHLSIVV